MLFKSSHYYCLISDLLFNSVSITSLDDVELLRTGNKSKIMKIYYTTSDVGLYNRLAVSPLIFHVLKRLAMRLLATGSTSGRNTFPSTFKSKWQGHICLLLFC